MRRIDDKDIVSKFKKANDYEIKKSGDEVLNKFLMSKDKSINEEIKTNEKKKSKYFVFGGIGVGAIALASVSLIIVLSNNTQNGNNPGTLPPDVITPNLTSVEGNVLANELLTFSSFSTFGSETSSLSKNVFKRQNVNKDDFATVVYSYDSIQGGVIEILNKDNDIRMSVQNSFNEEINGETYLYVDHYFSSEDNFKTPFMSFYYNDKDISSSVSNLAPKEGMLKMNDIYYDCLISKETENESNEYEEEITLRLENKASDTYMIIEKESEYEGRETENSYSIAYYDRARYFDEDSFIYKLTYEIENEGRGEELEVSVETPSMQCEFKNIYLMSNDPLTYRFEADYEDDLRKIEIENLLVNLKYTANGREYSANGVDTIIIK